MGAVEGVLVTVGAVVERHARLVEAERGTHGVRRAPVGPQTGGRGAGDGVAGHGEQRGDAEQFGPVPQPRPLPAPRYGGHGALTVPRPDRLRGAHRRGRGEAEQKGADHCASLRRSANDSSAVNCSERPDGPASGSLK